MPRHEQQKRPGSDATLEPICQIREEDVLCQADLVELRQKSGNIILTYANTSPKHQNIWMPEHYLSLVTYYGRMLSKGELNPLEVHFQHSNPADIQTYRDCFQSPVMFEQEENALIFREEDGSMEITPRNPHLHVVLEKQAEIHLKQISKEKQTIKRVREVIIKYLPKGNLDIQLASRELNMNRSTFYRKLKEEGTTFIQLVRRIRQDLAEAYLEQGLNISEITYLLGYTEPSNFQHAFKRWFGQNPGEYRQGLVIDKK